MTRNQGGRLPRLLLALLLALPGFAAADAPQADTVQNILAQLAAKPVVRAEFLQEKTLPSLKKPLRSEGSLLFLRERGALWRLRKPVLADLVVTREKMLQKTARTQSKLSLNRSPYGAAGGLLLQLLAGDGRQLHSAFEVVSAEKKGEHWKLVLKPRDAALKKVFSTLEAEGDSYLRQLFMREPGGGSTHIRISNPRSEPAAPTPDEHALFALLD